MSAGLDRIRRDVGDPAIEFPPTCWPLPSAPSQRPIGTEHRDRTDRRFVTLDPATSIDLDQAFAIEVGGRRHRAPLRDRRRRLVRAPGRSRSTSRRSIAASRCTSPIGGRRCIPTALSEGAASLLPDVDRPAVVFTVRVGDRRHAAARRRRAGDRAQPCQARLRHGDRRRPAGGLRRAAPPDRWPPSSGAAPRASSFPSSRSPATATASTRCGSGRGSPPRSRTRRSRWRPTSPSPTRCSPPTPACSG